MGIAAKIHDAEEAVKGRQLAGRGGGTSAVADHVLGVQTIGALCIMLYANSLIWKLVNLLATTGSRRRGKTKKTKEGRRLAEARDN